MNKAATREQRQHASQLRPYSYYPCQIPDASANVPLHWHREFELSYMLAGCGEFISGDEHFIAHAGDIVVTPPNMLHAIHLHQGQQQRYDTLVFSAEALGISANDRCSAEYLQPLVDGRCTIRGHITSTHPAYADIRRTVENIFDCARADTPQHDLLLKSSLLRFMWLLEAHGHILRCHASTPRSDAMRPVLTYIADSFREPITIEQLAEIAHLSKSYLMCRFKQTAGMGAGEYIARQRVRYACERLLATDDTVSAIALDSGFRNLSNFNRQFLRFVGCTPQAYRKLNQK